MSTKAESSVDIGLVFAEIFGGIIGLQKLLKKEKRN